MKLRIRGNSIRLRVSKTELAKIAAKGAAEDCVRFSSATELRYGIDVRPSGAVTASFDATTISPCGPNARPMSAIPDTTNSGSASNAANR